MRILADCLPTRPDSLLVLLPGAHMLPEDFRTQGFIAAVRERALAVDVQMPALDYTHVMAKTAVGTLHEQVIAPARAAGYRHIWLAGISLGGLTALLYAARHADELAGIHLLAPYPGTGDIVAEIRAHGGPLAWSATPAAEQGDERIAWRWLAQQAQAGHPLPVSFGCGEGDRFARNQRLFTELLPAARVRWLPGTHAWPAWQALWQDWLDGGALAEAAGFVNPLPGEPLPAGFSKDAS